MTRVLLHIGTEKTGTTSVQNFLAQNREVLLQHQVVYPILGQRKDAHFELVNELHPLDNNGRYMEFLPPLQHPVGHLWGKLKECIERHKDKTIVLSAEHFSSRLREQGLGYIRNFFDELNIKPEIIVFLRPQDEYIESTYSTFIKAGGTKTFSQVFDSYQNQPLRYDYSQLLRLWSGYFGKENVSVIPYQKSTGDARKQVLNAINITQHEQFDFSQSQSMNRKWGRDMLELARICNSKYTNLSPTEKNTFLAKCSNLLPAKPGERLMTSDQSKEVKSFFASSNEVVAESYFSKKELFTQSGIELENNDLQPILTKNTLIDLLFKTTL